MGRVVPVVLDAHVPAHVVDVPVLLEERLDVLRLLEHGRLEARDVDALLEVGAVVGADPLVVDPELVGRLGESGDREHLAVERVHDPRRARDGLDRRLAHGERERERLLPLGPGELAEVLDLDVVRARELLLRGVDAQLGDERGRVPRLEERPRHDEVAARSRVDAVRDDLGGVPGVRRLVELLEALDDGGVQVHEERLLASRELADEVAVLLQDLVVAALELGGPRDLVEGRGPHEDEPDARELHLERRDDVLVTLLVGVEPVVVPGAVAGVVHAEHAGDDGGLVGDHVAREALVDLAARSARHRVAAPPGVDEAHSEPREARRDVGLDVGRVETLGRDAVPVEDDAVVLLEEEVVGPRRRGGGRDREREEGSVHGRGIYG